MSRLDWVGLDWVGLRWVALGWVGLRWVGLRWVGLGWVGLVIFSFARGRSAKDVEPRPYRCEPAGAVHENTQAE